MDPTPLPRAYHAMSDSPPFAARSDGAPSGPIVTDASLLARMAAGDESALGQLYDRWARVVHAMVLRVVGDPADAEEIVEETFWQAWRQAARYEAARGAVSTWLVTIGRSRALDRTRSRRRQVETPATPHLLTELPAQGEDPGLTAELHEQRRIVLAALGELPAEQREALLLAYYGGLSQTEIAERTHTPLGTVKTRMRLALGKLRLMLPAPGAEDEA